MIGGVLMDGFDGGKAKDFGIEAVELHKGFCKKGREDHQIEALECTVIGGSRAAMSSVLVHSANFSHIGTVESGMRALNDSFDIRTGTAMTSCPWRARMSFVRIDNGVPLSWYK